MMKYIFIFIGLFITTVAMADMCPAGYSAVERPNVIIVDGACPSGYVSAGEMETCPGEPRILNYKTPTGNAGTIKLDTTRRTAPSLNMRINDTIWYANMQAVSTPVSGKMHVRMVHNNTPTIFQIMDNINPGPANGMCVIGN